VYPRDAEEVERGALEVLIKPVPPGAPGLDVQARNQPGAPGLDSETWDRSAASTFQPFLATCALGFRDPIAPTGVWSTPEPEKICAISGGYAYIIDTTAPETFTMIPFRPVLEVRTALAENLLLFVGHHSILAWGPGGLAWESRKLSDEGISITAIAAGTLHGKGWQMLSDSETGFTLDLRTGAVLD
jgi:hypothetical protein